jgi:alpha,alpha-trehalase
VAEVEVEEEGEEGGGGGGSGGGGGRGAASEAAAAADALLRRCLPAVERELAHWRSFPKQVACCVPAEAPGGGTGATHHALARYWAQWEGARPESQREDEATAAEALAAAAPGSGGAAAPGPPDRRLMRRRLMRDLASAAESGWDFSTRWMPPPPDAAAAAAAEGGGLLAAWEAEEVRQSAAAAPPAPAPAHHRRRPSLASLRTTRVIPADLNAFLYRAERDAAWAARRLGRGACAAELEALARRRARAMRELLWDEGCACWRDGWMVRRFVEGRGAAAAPAASGGSGGVPPLDDDDGDGDDDDDGHDDDNEQQRERPWVVHRSPAVYASNYVPLWCGLLDDDDDDGDESGGGRAAERAARSLVASGLLQPGGVAASLYASGQQWDWPNAWPPLQHALAEACARQGRSEEARAVGLAVAAAYARAVLQGWGGGGGDGGDPATAELHEKYDARGGGREGGGGEYAPQVGFGWTNGALLALLADGLV